MLLPPDDEVLQALCNLEDNPDFLKVRQWILNSEQEQLRVLRSAEGPEYLRAQGADRVLLAFVDFTAEPRKVAAKTAMKRAGITPFPS